MVPFESAHYVLLPRYGSLNQCKHCGRSCIDPDQPTACPEARELGKEIVEIANI